jgi:hypothetical protein
MLDTEKQVKKQQLLLKYDVCGFGSDCFENKLK